jgi:CheY-like chemotaxis protein
MDYAMGQPKILVVDDNHDAADTLATLLGILACDTRVAYDGREAVELARSFHPDMVILDLEMPAMDGYEAARVLRESEQDHPVLVALSAHADAADRAHAALVGFDAHLSKPIDGQKLYDLTQRLLPSS